MKTITLPRDTLLNVLDLPSAAIEDRITGNGRWSIYHEIVFAYEGRFYKTTYSEGATESQSESPWEYNVMALCVEVEQKEVLDKQWVPVAE